MNLIGEKNGSVYLIKSTKLSMEKEKPLAKDEKSKISLAVIIQACEVSTSFKMRKKDMLNGAHVSIGPGPFALIQPTCIIYLRKTLLI